MQPQPEIILLYKVMPFSLSTEPTLLWLPAKLHELLTHCKLASDLRADLVHPTAFSAS